MPLRVTRSSQSQDASKDTNSDTNTAGPTETIKPVQAVLLVKKVADVSMTIIEEERATSEKNEDPQQPEKVSEI